VRNDVHATAAKVATFPSSTHDHGPTHLTRGGGLASEDPSDPLLAFASEDETAIAVKAAPEALSATTPARSRLKWSHAAFALLALVVGVQGALMLLWLRPQPAAPVAESGAVTVASEPAGAPVSIDGVARGVTPLTLTLGSGAHRVEIGEGDRVRVQTINVARGGETSVHVELAKSVAAEAPTSGGLQIAEPVGARVWIDGQPRGMLPVSVSDLAPGVRAVRILTAGGTVINRSVTIEPGVTASLIVSLGARAQAAPGWISIASPITAQIYEDGTLLGSSDTPRIMIPSGRHELELSNRALGFRAQRSVQVTAGQTTAITLDVPKGSVNINALPWANVWLDGRPIGETPIANLALPLGTHELIFRHPELGEHRRTVVVTAGAPVRIGIDLRKGAQ
jgi:hypothetical protein